jgi:hypothetical protein
MTVKEYILEKEIKSVGHRLERMKELGAPEIIITTLENEVKALEQGELKIGGDLNLLDETFESREIKTGRGGNSYVQINGSINYFPNAKYGRYIVKNNK